MNQQPAEWRSEFFLGLPPLTGVPQPSPLPPEFRRENRDLRIPRRAEDQDHLEDLLLFYPFF